MRALSEADTGTFREVRFVLTDMDDTLTHNGQLAAQTYDALERLRDAGLKVIVVTAAPAGWCDQMARMWPVDGVIGENGGFYFSRNRAMPDVTRLFWHDEKERPTIRNLLAEIGRQVEQKVVFAQYADDHPFRLTSIAFARPSNRIAAKEVLIALRDAGAQATMNNLWILGWLGGYDKLAMSQRVLSDHFRLDIQKRPGAVLYVGDSVNDAPMFGCFQHSVGVSTVRQYLPEMAHWPKWIASGPGGSGFVEAAEAVLQSQAAIRKRGAL